VGGVAAAAISPGNCQTPTVMLNRANCHAEPPQPSCWTWFSINRAPETTV